MLMCIQNLSKSTETPEVLGVWAVVVGLFRPKLMTKLFCPVPDGVAGVDLLGRVPHPTSTQTTSILPAEKYPNPFFSCLLSFYQIKDYDTKPFSDFNYCVGKSS